MRKYIHPTTEVVNLLANQIMLSGSPTPSPDPLLHFDVAEGTLNPSAGV